MSPNVRNRLRIISRGLNHNCYVRLRYMGRTYIFMEGRWWTAPDL